MQRRLRKIAREVGARLAVVCRSRPPIANSRMRCPARRIEAAAGEDALVEAAQRPADWVMAAISGAIGLEADACGDRTRRDRRARQQGMPGLRGQAVHAPRGRARARRFCRSTPSTTRSSRRSAAGHRADVKRVILTASGGPFRTWSLEQIRAATPEQALRASELVDGAEGHHRLGNADEQRPRADRGASSVRAASPNEIDVLVHPQSIVHGMVEFRDGSVVAQLGSPRHAHSDRALSGLAATRIDGPAPRLDLAAVAAADLRGARSGPFSGAGAGAAAHGDGRGGAHGAECRRRGRGWRIYRRPDQLSRRLRRWSRRRLMRRLDARLIGRTDRNRGRARR